MKTLKIFFYFGLLISLINCTCVPYANHTSSAQNIFVYEGEVDIIDTEASVSNCKKREFSEAERNANAYKFCYVDYTCNFSDEDDDDKIYAKVKSCSYVTKELYSNLDKIGDEYKRWCKNFKIDCNGTLLAYFGKILYLTFILLILL